MKRLWQSLIGGGRNSQPIPFGYKMGWIAAKSASSENVASAAGLRAPRSATWQAGIDAAYNHEFLFVTPPIHEWVCIVGWPLLGDPSVDAISKKVVSLSSTFGEAQGFGGYRVPEYHHWMLARGGKLIRCFAYIGERGELLADYGPLTPAEDNLRFFQTPKEQWHPNERDVMAVASGWSFDPSKLTSTSAPSALGLIGKA